MAHEKKEKRKIRRRTLGLIFIVCGIVILVLMLIPFIPVLQGPRGFSFPRGPEVAVVVTHIYSPFDFVYMMFSNKYSLGNYVLVGILCLAIFCIAVFLIVRGIILVATGKSVGQDKRLEIKEGV